MNIVEKMKTNWRRFAYTIGFVLFVVLLIGMTALALVGYYDPDFVTAFATIVLAVVTFGYVIIAGETLQMNRELLIENQKEHIIQLIVVGIDPLVDELSRLTNPTTINDGFPHISKIDYDETLIRDIERKNVNIISDINELNDIIDEYNYAKCFLIDYFERVYFDDLPEQYESELVNIVSESEGMRRYDGDNAIKSKLRDLPSKKFAYSVESISAGEITSSLVYTVEEDYERFVTDIRKDHPQKQVVDYIVSLNSKILQKSESIQSDLDESRMDLKSRYNIVEPEIMDVRKEKDDV